MRKKNKPRGYWTKARCAAAAKRFKYSIKFKKGSPSAYGAARKNGWLDEICGHMEELQKPPGYWTKDRCAAEARRFKTRTEFMKGSSSAYAIAHRNGWLDEICGHMVSPDPLIYWTRKRCAAAAKKYKTRTEFSRKRQGAYDAARRNGWLDEICAHMEELQKRAGYWTKENCASAARKCKTRTEFEERFSGAYTVALKKGWMDEICAHMEELQKRAGYWTKEKCAAEAKKYKHRSVFQNECPSAYDAAQRNGWMDDICAHMEPLGNRGKRGIYALEFKDCSVYVGLTDNFDRRKLEHEAESHNKHIREKLRKGMSFEVKKITDYLHYKLAQEKEESFKEKYKKGGWKILNIAKTGALGGGYIIWTKEKCAAEAKKHKHRTVFQNECPGGYNAALKKGWLDKICAHMEELQKPAGYWTKEKCATEARKHKTSSQLKKRSSGAHRAAYKNGWLDDFFTNRKKENGHWHNESNIVNAIRETKSKTPSEFQKKCPGGYKGMLRLGLREKLFPEGKPYGKWNKIENIKKEIIRTKSETRTEFKERSVGAYEGALRKNWDLKLFKKMKRRGSPKKRGIYVFEFTDGSVYVGLTDKMPRRKYEHLNSSSNKHVKEKIRKGIFYKFKILTPCILTSEQSVDKENHYLNKYRKKGYEILNIAKPGSLGGNIVRLTEAVCAAKAKKYNHRGDFQKNSFSEYKAAWSGGFLDKICAHMTKKKRENKWTYESCADEAKKDKTKTEFRRRLPGAYTAAYVNKWLADICAHMISPQKPHGYWSKERCAAKAKKYKYRGDFQKHSPSAYVIALRNGWLDEICKHMKKRSRND